MPDDVEDPTSDLSTNERAARIGFATGRVVWFGGADDWWPDWVFWVENEHTLVSMWRGHALHPFDRMDRVVYLCCVLCFSLFMSAYVQSEHPIDENFWWYGAWVTLASALLVAYDYLLKFLATSPCMHPGGACYDACWLCRDCCLDCGKQGLYLCAGGSLGFLIGGIVIGATADDINPGAFFATWIVMRVLSYMGELGPLAYYFYTKREKQRQYWLDGVKGGPYPFGPGVPDSLYLRESRADGDARKWPTSRDSSSRGQSRENPLRQLSSSAGSSPGSSSSSSSSGGSARAVLDKRARQESREKREKQIEMLRQAREKVRNRDAVGGSSSDKSKSRDALDALGSRL